MQPTATAIPVQTQASTASGPPQPAPASPEGTGNTMASIPVHSQGVASASPVNEDEELDKIMHEVGHELKKTEKAPAKHHFHFELKHHKKTEAKFSAQPRPVMDVKALPVSAPVARPAATAAPVVQ